MAFDPNQDHSISLDEASKLTKRYRDSRSSDKDSISAVFGKKAFTDVLAQDDCKGIRIYYAKNDEGQVTLVFVGVNEKGDDLYKEMIMEWGGLCPPMCGAANPLNSDA